MFTGCSLYFIANFLDFLDEIFAAPEFFDLLDDYTELAGLALITIAFILSSRKTLRTLAQITYENQTDSLTGLYNRRYLMHKFSEFLHQNFQSLNPVTVAFLDIDNFKKCNDKLGHEEGDKLLKIFGNTIRSFIRESDYAFRYGGEEFIVIFTNNTISKTFNIMKRFMQQFNNDTKNINIDKKIYFTLSIGLAKYTDKEKLIDAINQADSAMYKSKRDGKNRISIYDK